MKVGIITDIEFWRPGNGQNARIQEMVRFLKLHSDLTIYFLGEATACLPKTCVLNPHEKDLLFNQFHKSEEDLFIVVKLHLDWLIPLLPSHIPVYLDALDLNSLRYEQFLAFKRPWDYISFEEEIERMSRFDKVIFLQEEEKQKVATQISEERLLCCPHPIAAAESCEVRETVQHIAFIGGPGWPNVDGILWFHNEVMPLLGPLEEKCRIDGAFLYSPHSLLIPRLQKGWVISSLEKYYKMVDIAFNPCLYGSGLKIKTVEALAHGVPLVTTRCGAQGLMHLANTCFLLADKPQEFAEAIDALASSYCLRKELAANGLAFAKKHLTQKACFTVLLDRPHLSRPMDESFKIGN